MRLLTSRRRKGLAVWYRLIPLLKLFILLGDEWRRLGSRSATEFAFFLQCSGQLATSTTNAWRVPHRIRRNLETLSSSSDCSTCSRPCPTSFTKRCSGGWTQQPHLARAGGDCAPGHRVSHIHLPLWPPARGDYGELLNLRSAGLQAHGLCRVGRAAGLGPGGRAPVDRGDVCGRN